MEPISFVKTNVSTFHETLNSEAKEGIKDTAIHFVYPDSQDNPTQDGVGVYLGSQCLGEPSSTDSTLSLPLCVGRNAQGSGADSSQWTEVAIGHNSSVGNGGMGMGTNAKAGPYSIAFGTDAKAEDYANVAIGYGAMAPKELDPYTPASGCVAIGRGASVNGSGGIAIGGEAKTSKPGQIVLGYSPIPSSTADLVVGPQVYNSETQSITNLLEISRDSIKHCGVDLLSKILGAGNGSSSGLSLAVKNIPGWKAISADEDDEGSVFMDMKTEDNHFISEYLFGVIEIHFGYHTIANGNFVPSTVVCLYLNDSDGFSYIYPLPNLTGSNTYSIATIECWDVNRFRFLGTTMYSVSTNKATYYTVYETEALAKPNTNAGYVSRISLIGIQG